MTKIIVLLCTCLLFACASDKIHSEHEDEHGDHAHEGAKGETIDFDKEKAESIGLQTKIVQLDTFTEVIKTSGRILAAQGDEQTLVATLPGVVAFRKTAFIEGTAVRKGQTILSLVTGNLAEGDLSVRTRALYEKAKSEYERANELIKDRIISEKEWNQAVSDYETARAAFEAIGGEQSGKGGGIDLCSPINGYLKDLRVKEGDYVATGQALATISQNNRLQLRVEIPEKYYTRLPLIRTAHFKTPYGNKVYRLADLNGQLLSYAKAMDENAFYIPVTFEFDNVGDLLPGGYVEAYLLSSPIQHTLSVPLTALIEEQGVYSVFLQEDEDCYRKQEVKTGADNGLDVQILSGLKAGDRVVTEAAYHLKLASATSAMPAHNH